MNFSLKEAFGFLLGIVTAIVVVVTFFRFGLFSGIIRIIEGVI